MHTSIPVASVRDPVNIYGNAFVEIDAVDDITATVVVRNRQGVNLMIYTGPFEVMADKPGRGWIVHTDTGDVTITVEEGCGCGGTSIVAVPTDG